MKRKDHIAFTERIFGKGYEEVHIWIDELYKPYLGFNHWLERHHLVAVREQYGDDTIEFWVALMHILCDWRSHVGINFVPQTRADCKEMLQEYMLIGE